MIFHENSHEISYLILGRMSQNLSSAAVVIGAFRVKQELRAFQIEFEELAKTEDGKQLWTRFKKKIQLLMESYIPAKTINGNTVYTPWISKQVKPLTRKCKKLFAKQRKTRKAKDIRMYKETKTRLQKLNDNPIGYFIENVIEVGELDQEQQPKQKRFWAYIKSLQKDSSGIAPLKDNGTLYANPKDVADIPNRHKSVDTGYVPKIWRTANVTAIFKKGINSSLTTTGQYLSQVFATRSRSM